MSILPETVPTHDEFRAFGMTSHAAQFPRSELQIKMFAAWLGYPLDKPPDPCKYFANEAMKNAWERAEAEVREHIEAKRHAQAVANNYKEEAPMSQCPIPWWELVKDEYIQDGPVSRQAFRNMETGEV